MAPEQLTDMGLEWEQMTAVQRPYGRRVLAPGTKLLLLGLRVYVIVAVPLVVYAFWRSLT